MAEVKTKAQRIEDAWHDNFHVANSESCYYADMTCDKCKKNIRGYYLIQDRTNRMLRGNEHDETYLFHRKCSSEHEKWKEHDDWVKETNKKAEVRVVHISEVKSLIKKYELDADDLFDTSNYY